jgi:hypothetical protein
MALTSSASSISATNIMRTSPGAIRTDKTIEDGRKSPGRGGSGLLYYESDLHAKCLSSALFFFSWSGVRRTTFLARH